MFSRWLELGSGLAAGLLGLLIVTFVLFGPFYQGAVSGSCTVSPSGGSICSPGHTTSATLAQVNGGYPPLALLYFGLLALVLLSLLVSTILHWRSGRSVWRRWLWGTTGLLVIVALAGLDLWVLVAPSVLLALVAAVAAYYHQSPAAAR
jgi:hypothetical protein